MLVISRRKNESVNIGDGTVVVTVLEVRPGGVVKLGIQAARDIPVHRQEVQDKIDSEPQKLQPNP